MSYTLQTIFIAMLIFLASCHHDLKENKAAQSSEFSTVNPELTDSLVNYWDDYDFKDTSRVFNADLGELDFVNYIVFLNQGDSVARVHSVRNMLDRTLAQPDVFAHYVKLFTHYLYDPNSPFRDELSYIVVADYLKDQKELSDTEREDFKVKLALMNKNRPGQMANDFSFINTFGAEQRLYDVRSAYKLLIFYDPGCSSCANVLSQLRSSYVLLEQQEAKKLQFVAVVPWDAYAVWKDYQSEIPQAWVNGYNKNGQVLDGGLYNIQAYPSIYLIDRHNKVLLKDTDVINVELYLKQHSLI